MTIKRLPLVAVFDQTKSQWPSQSAILPDVARSVLEDLSSVSGLSSKSLGRDRVAGGLDIASRMQIAMPKSGDAQTDKENGSRVGLASITPAFKAEVDVRLLANTGSPSALLSLGTVLETAISQTPPGLIVKVAAGLNLQAHPDLNPLHFQIVADGAIADAATATLSADFNLIAIPNLQIGILQCFPPNKINTFTDAILGQWLLTNTSTVNLTAGGTAEFITTTDTGAGIVQVTQDGTPVGNQFGSAPATPGFFQHFVQRSFGTAGFFLAQIIGANFSGFLTKSFLLAAGIADAIVTPTSLSWQLTNNTGSPIADGAVVMDVNVVGQGLVEIEN